MLQINSSGRSAPAGKVNVTSCARPFEQPPSTAECQGWRFPLAAHGPLGSHDGRYGRLNVWVVVKNFVPAAGTLAEWPTVYMFRVSGCEKVCPGVVVQSVPVQPPASQA